MARDDLHFRLRIPDDLKAKVAKEAIANHRSMTAEIIARLEASFHISDGEAARIALKTGNSEQLMNRLFDDLKEIREKLDSLKK